MNEQELKPNKLTQPFSYYKWKIIGDKIDMSSRLNLKRSKPSWIDFLLRYSKNTTGLIGIFLLILLILGAIFIPVFSKDPEQININDQYLSFMQKGHIFGTDNIGRDYWARLWSGMRFSLGLAAAVTIVDLLIGVLLGILMGKYETFDRIMQYILKIIVNIPSFIMMIIIVVIFNASFWTMVLSLTVFGWIGMSLQIRAQTKRYALENWNIASKILGTPEWKQVKAFVPHLMSMITTQLITTIPGAIIAEASLAFIGLSVNDHATLGTLISDGTTIITLFPRYTLVPSFLLIMLVTSIQFIGLSTQVTLRRTR